MICMDHTDLLIAGGGNNPFSSNWKRLVSAERARTGVRLNPMRVVVIDHAEIFRAGIRSIVSGDDRYVVLGEHRGWNEAASTVLHDDPDVVIVEWAEVAALQQDPHKARVAQQVKGKMLVTALSFTLNELKAILNWGVGGVVLRSVNSAYLMEAIDRVADGGKFVDLKLTNALLSMLRDPATGDPSRSSELTDYEQRLLPFLAEGLTNKEIARRLGASDKSIKYHVAKVFRKLYVTNRAQFAASYARGDYVFLLGDQPTEKMGPPKIEE